MHRLTTVVVAGLAGILVIPVSASRSAAKPVCLNLNGIVSVQLEGMPKSKKAKLFAGKTLTSPEVPIIASGFVDDLGLGYQRIGWIETWSGEGSDPLGTVIVTIPSDSTPYFESVYHGIGTASSSSGSVTFIDCP